VVAEHQTSGRGRLGRTWESEPGVNLLFSLVLRPTIRKEAAGLLTFYSAVFIARALEQITEKSLECKWPNDILVNNKKCCGILLENSFLQDRFDFSVIGIGINVNQAAFSNELGERATSLFREFGVTIDRTKLLRTLLREADKLLPSVERGEVKTIMDEWNARCTMFGKPVTIAQGTTLISGTAMRLNGEGGLVLETSTGTSTFYAGDVTVVTS
jgi:BirA family biotin operon repressor/biotin-[acetyl-CoA-carboxylase] ligase